MLFNWFQYDQAGFGTWDEPFVAVKIDDNSPYYECIDAACDAFRDEFGVHPFENKNQWETDESEFFELVAVPDDVAEALPTSDGIVILLGEELSRV